jgi:hypothetical protein
MRVVVIVGAVAWRRAAQASRDSAGAARRLCEAAMKRP